MTVALMAHYRDEPPSVGVHVADEKGARTVTVMAIEVDRHVDVHDIAILERPIIGNAMKKHVVHRRAQRLGESAHTQRVRQGSSVGRPAQLACWMTADSQRSAPVIAER
jgi:hypothetical protein